MARSAFWRMGASVLAAALLGAPAVARAQDDDGREPLIRAFRMAGGGSHLGVNLSDLGRDDRTRLKLPDERGALVKDVQPDTTTVAIALDDPDAMTPQLVRVLVGAGADIQSVVEERHSLEDVYLNLIQHQPEARA